MTSVLRHFAYRRSPDQDAATPARHPVVIVGAGPVGLTLALDLARRAVPVVLIDDSDRIGEGSRAICFAKRTLEIFDRLGLAGPMVEKGVTWSRGKVFRGEALLYAFDLLPEGGHKQPAFINLQQYHVEAALAEAVLAEPLVDLRWRNRLAGIVSRDDHAALTIETPDGPCELIADHVVACDGARSPTRALLGLPFEGAAFDDQFLIADVRMTAPFPTERWFWFDPPFHDGRSALLHKQPDDIWRIDLQLGRDADAAHERRPEVVRPRIARMLGHEDFELEWVSVYRFQCRRLARFVHGRVIFAGDAAHQVSPFGARGANSGIQDADNLAWKLAAVLKQGAPKSLLDSYDRERGAAADENILHSTRATDFIAPASPGEVLLRDAALALAGRTGFGKALVNSGRLSRPSAYAGSPLSTPDEAPWTGGLAPGKPFLDAPLTRADGGRVWLSEAFVSGRPVLLVDGPLSDPVVQRHGPHPEEPPSGPAFGRPKDKLRGVSKDAPDGSGASWSILRDARPRRAPQDEGCGQARTDFDSGRGLAIVELVERGGFSDPDGLCRTRYALSPGAVYLFRPDGHVAARFGRLDGDDLAVALARMEGRE